MGKHQTTLNDVDADGDRVEVRRLYWCRAREAVPPMYVNFSIDISHLEK